MMNSNSPEQLLLQFVGSPDPTSVKRLYHRLCDSSWMHQNNFMHTLYSVLQSCFQGLLPHEYRRIIDALIEHCIIFTLDHATGTVFFKLRSDIKTPGDLAARIMSGIESPRTQKTLRANVTDAPTPALTTWRPPNVSTATTGRWQRAREPPGAPRSGSQHNDGGGPHHSRAGGNAPPPVSYASSVMRPRPPGLPPPPSTPAPANSDDMIAGFLHCLRKQGMDMLLPPDLHDNCLVCVYSALKIYNHLAHKELIDLIMAAQQGPFQQQLQGATKTKIRGLIAILKNAKVLMTKDATRDVAQETCQLLTLDVLQDQAVAACMVTMVEELRHKKATHRMRVPTRALRTKDVMRDIYFHIVTEEIIEISNAVAAEVFYTACSAGPPVKVRTTLEVEKEAVLLEMDETVLDIRELRRRHDDCIMSAALTAEYPVNPNLLKGLVWEKSHIIRAEKMERLEQLQHEIGKFFFEKHQQAQPAFGMPSRGSLGSMSDGTSIEDLPSTGFHSSSQDTWDAGREGHSVQPYRPPLPPSPMPPSHQSHHHHTEPVLTTRSNETLAFVPESRYAQQHTNQSHIQFSRERMPGDPTNYFPNDIQFHRSRSDSRECYQIQYSHSSGDIKAPSTLSPDDSIFRSFSCDEDDQLSGLFNAVVRQPSPGYRPYLMYENESLTSDLSVSEEDSSPSMRVYADLILPEGGIGAPQLAVGGGAIVEDVLTRILDTAAKPLSSSSSSHMMDPLHLEQPAYNVDDRAADEHDGEDASEVNSVHTAQTDGVERISGDIEEEGGLTSRSEP